MIKTIGVLTSGGDAPGMNAAVRAVVRAALKKGMTVYGVKRGYCGLLEDDIEPMDEMSVAGIISRGGTMLYTARSAEFRTEQGVLKAKATCEKYGLEGLVVIGGDGSFRGAADLSAHGILCVGLPGTIDNDIACTDYTIGYDTAMNTAMELMDKLSDTSQSHYRCSVVEVMGRGAGYIALNTGVASGALEIITKEKPYDLDKIAKKMMEFKARGKQNFIIVVAENIGHSEEICKLIQEKTGIESRATILGHVQRGDGKLSLQLDNLCTSVRPKLRIQVGKRFIHQENSRLACNSASERDSLFLSTRKLAGKPGQVVLDLQEPAGIHDPVKNLALVDMPDLQAHANVVINGQLRIQRIILEYDRNITFHRWLVIDPDSVKVQVAFGNFLKSRSHAKHG